MKKHIIYLLVSGFALLSNMALTSCSDDDVEGANGGHHHKNIVGILHIIITARGEGQVRQQWES